ncbi:MAG: FAD-dependent oxidoreductase [Myxococcota bacterium]
MALDVRVLGAGFAGLAVAHALRARGVRVGVVDPRGALAGASGASLGVVLPGLAEDPDRFAYALGEARAGELCAFAKCAFAKLPGFARTGVTWRASPEALAAARRIGLAVADDVVEDAGTVDLAALRAALACEVVAAPEPAEVTVWATGWSPADAWIADKVMPVRWQSLRLAGPSLARPLVTRQTTVIYAGGLDALGARWATPHLEVGETEPDPSPAVSAMLERLARQDFPDAGPPGGARAGIVAEACDGLPVVGPVPGRPREVACVGFGALGLALLWRCAESVARGLCEGDDPEVPAALRSGRFR